MTITVNRHRGFAITIATVCLLATGFSAEARPPAAQTPRTDAASSGDEIARRVSANPDWGHRLPCYGNPIFSAPPCAI